MDVTFPSGEQHASPILVVSIRPRKTGAGLLDVEFWHANYAEGVQRKHYPLRVLRRTPGYCLLAERMEAGDAMLVILRELTPDWIALHRLSMTAVDLPSSNLQDAMDRAFLPAGRAAIGL